MIERRLYPAKRSEKIRKTYDDHALISVVVSVSHHPPFLSSHHHPPFHRPSTLLTFDPFDFRSFLRLSSSFILGTFVRLPSFIRFLTLIDTKTCDLVISRPRRVPRSIDRHWIYPQIPSTITQRHQHQTKIRPSPHPSLTNQPFDRPRQQQPITIERAPSSSHPLFNHRSMPA